MPGNPGRRLNSKDADKKDSPMTAWQTTIAAAVTGLFALLVALVTTCNQRPPGGGTGGGLATQGKKLDETPAHPRVWKNGHTPREAKDRPPKIWKHGDTPRELDEFAIGLQDAQAPIRSFDFTDDGAWVVVTDDEIRCDGPLPKGFEEEVQGYLRNGWTILGISLSGKGGWAIVWE
jgi:hypothetical protein